MTNATFTVQRDVFLRDSSSAVRVALLQNLARSQAPFPEATLLLTQALTDSMQAVREEAESLRSIEK
jgi:hypothetical protein